jgi:hypothetical protein
LGGRGGGVKINVLGQALKLNGFLGASIVVGIFGSLSCDCESWIWSCLAARCLVFVDFPAPIFRLGPPLGPSFQVFPRIF